MGTATGMAMAMMSARLDSKRLSLPLTSFWLMCAGVSLGAVTLSEPVSAGDWVFDHSSTVELSHVDRSGDDGYSGQILQGTPHLRLHGEGGRFIADVNYNPTISLGTSDTDPKFLTHELLATSRLEAIDDRLFIGADASARLTGNSSSGARVDAINYNSDGGQQSYSLGISPEYRQHLNRYADFVSSNRFDWVTYGGNDDGDGSDGSRGQTLNAAITNGRRFTDFSWSLDATERRIFYDGDQEDERRTAYTLNLGQRLSQHWAVNGSVGYEDNDIQTDRSDTNGSIWDVGATWTPNPRTKVHAEYGDRYYGDRYAGSVSHTSRRIRLGLDFTREVTTRREQQLVDSFFFLQDSNGNPVLDASGNPISANDPQLQDTDGDFLNTQWRGVMTITGRRTTVTITGTAANRDYEESSSSDDEDSYILSLNATRDLGSNYSTSLNGRVEKLDSDGDDDSDTYDVGFTLRKHLSPRTSTALDLSYRDYDHDRSSESYTEKRIGVSLTTTWL